MLKYLAAAILAVFSALGAAHAQQQEAVLQKLEVPAADFDIIVATAKPSGAVANFRANPDPLIVYPAGSELAFAVDEDVQKMFKDIGSLQYPIAAFHVERRSGQPSNAAIIYIVPKDATLASAVK